VGGEPLVHRALDGAEHAGFSPPRLEQCDHVGGFT
jgi:hypothetical protein